MATTGATLVQRTRRFVRDYPDLDQATVSLSSFGTTVTVADTSMYSPRWPIEIDTETLLVTSLASTTTLTVRRGMYGSVAAAHAVSASVLIRPAFYTVEVLDAINQAKDDAYPLVYKPVLDTTLTGDGSTYEFTVPNMPGTYSGDTIVIPYLSRVEVKPSGDTAYRETTRWEIRRGATPKIKFHEPPSSGDVIRVHGYGPFPDLASTTDTVDTQFPKRIERFLDLGAASHLLASGEAGRVRMTAGAVDDREQANRAGSSLAMSNSLYARWRAKLSSQPMPPLPPHVVSVV